MAEICVHEMISRISANKLSPSRLSDIFCFCLLSLQYIMLIISSLHQLPFNFQPFSVRLASTNVNRGRALGRASHLPVLAAAAAAAAVLMLHFSNFL